MALNDALTACFWYKPDLYSWAKAAVEGEPTFLAGIGWTDSNQYKRDSVSLFVDRLVREQDEYPGLLLRVLMDVAAMEEFPKLQRTEDAAAKIAAAKAAVARLRVLTAPYEAQLRANEKLKERIETSRLEAEERQATLKRVRAIKERYVGLRSVEPRTRGYELEKVLRDTFDAFDLDPRASFRVAGEQIDGGFTYCNQHYILEAKWHKALTSRADLDVLDAKVHRRSDNTFGLFVSINGFEPTAIDLHSGRHSPLILMDGGDLYAVLDERIGLPDLIARKSREAAMTGRVFISAAAILAT